MSSTTTIPSLALVALLAAAPAFALCGNGALETGEQCDATAPGGEAACAGACVPAGLANQCTCSQPANDRRRYVVVAGTKLRLGSKALVGLGNLGVTEAGGFAKIGRNTSIPGGSDVVADGVRVLNGAQLGRLFANDAFIHVGATLTNGGPFAVTLPLVLFPPGPPLPSGGDGALPVDVPADGTEILAPGAYDAVAVGPGAKLILRGLPPGAGAGVYHLRKLTLMPRASMLVHNPVVVFVTERLAFSGDGLTANAFIGPSSSARIIAGDVQLIAQGGARLSHGAVATAHIRAPRINVGANTIFTGQLVGDKVSISSNAALFLQGGCGDGRLDPDEQCDTSAPNGEAACPGLCIPGDPQGEGRITLGQPGQCTCPCTSDAQCDDGSACNGRETCQNRICVVGLPLDCNDHNPCTRDCDPAIGCVNTPVADGTGCNDRNPCTSGDACQGGSCTPGAPVLDGSACSDQDTCTVGDSCRGGVCTSGPERDCSDDNSCSVDTCDALTGCQHTLLAEGDPCTDASVCTLLDTCHSGTCVGGEQRNCDDGNPCTADSCDSTAGCQHVQLPDGTACGPGRTCSAGVCP